MSKIFRSVGRKWKKRIEYCDDKVARCQPLPPRCANCSCYDGLLYYEDFGYCMDPLPTTPPTTTTDKPTTRRGTTSSSTATTTASKNVIDTTESTTSKSTATKSTSSPPNYTPEQSTTPSTSFKSGVSMTSSKVGSTTSVAWEASGGKTTVKPRTTTYPQKASTTGSQGNKDMIRGGNKSNAAAIAGAIVGVIILIVLAAVFLYLRKRKQKKGAKDVNGKAPLDIHFNDLKSREEPVSPSSPPDGIYTYADAGTISRPNGSTLNAVGNPAYSDNIPISEPFYNVLEADQNDSQPIYREVVPEQVYMDPNANRNAGGNQDQQEQPIYRELEEEPPAYAPIDQPIYRELEEETPASPVYADITSSTVENTGAQSPRQYQELNYAATANVYQPLDNDWKSQKYNR